jgi:hypothetical protein
VACVIREVCWRVLNAGGQAGVPARPLPEWQDVMKLAHRARAIAAPAAVLAEAGRYTVRAKIGAGFEAYLLAAGSPAHTVCVTSRLSGPVAEISTVTDQVARRALASLCAYRCGVAVMPRQTQRAGLRAGQADRASGRGAGGR